MAEINRKEFGAIAHDYVKEIYMDSCKGGLTSLIDQHKYDEALGHVNSWMHDLQRVKTFIMDLRDAYEKNQTDDIYM